MIWLPRPSAQKNFNRRSFLSRPTGEAIFSVASQVRAHKRDQVDTPQTAREGETARASQKYRYRSVAQLAPDDLPYISQ